MATIGCYDENTLEWTVKQALDIIVLRFVLEAMKLEYFVHIPYSRQITRKLTTKSTTKEENLQEKIMPNLFLESKMNEIEDLQDTINIFYKTNIFDEMIKILNKSIEANLIKFEKDKKIDENSKARFRKKIRKILKDSLDSENLQDSLYTALCNHAKKIKRSKD